jgi:hypothetical protein
LGRKPLTTQQKGRRGKVDLLEVTPREKNSTEVGSRAQRRALEGQDHQEEDH